jgi:hypothetical protein
MQERPYNPLDEHALAESLVRELIQRPCSVLPPDRGFPGAGLYLIYYSGAFPAYGSLAALNHDACHAPIYVGKASPAGTRRGLVDLDAPIGTVLYSRLREHADSITVTENLRLGDFRCRYVVTSVLWLAVGESLLIRRYRPLWNTVVDGFGNHDPGSGRRSMSRRPEWDTLHPGRTWAKDMLPSTRDREQIEEAVRRHLGDLKNP